MQVIARLIAILFLLVFPWVAMLPAGAAEVLAVGDPSRIYYGAFMEGVKENSGTVGARVTEVTTSSVGSMSPQTLAKYDAVLTIGTIAAREKFSFKPSQTIVHALVSEDILETLRNSSAKGIAHSTLLVLEQPVARMLALAQIALPERKRLGVIYGPRSIRHAPDVRQQARLRGFQLVEKQVSNENEVGSALQAMVGQIDLLLALPDQDVVNPNTAKSLILDSYLHEIALVGYSHALVKAGALMAVHSTPEQFGRQAVELVSRRNVQDEGGPQIVYPRYYQVTINYQVARALGIDLPSENELSLRLHQVEVAP